MNKFLKLFLILLCLMFITFSISCFNQASRKEIAIETEKTTNEKLEEQPKGAEGETTVLEEERPVESEEDEEIDKLSLVLQKVGPSVVNIEFEVKSEDGSFGKLLSSGTIFTNDGYIISASPIVENLKKITVTLQDGTQVLGVLVGMDKNTNIAVIKIDAQNLEISTFVAEDVKVGEPVLIIGRPLGEELDFSQGFVLATGTNRTISPDNPPLVGLIETKVKSGVGGGSLVNMKSQIIGIIIVIQPLPGSDELSTFATPSDIVVNIANQIIEYGRARTPFIGIEMGENNTAVVGVYIQSVVEGSPAEEAGLKGGDIIAEFNYKKIQTPYELLAQMLKHNVGDIVKLKVFKDEVYTTLDINLVEVTQVQEQKESSVEEYPASVGYVNDFAHIIDKEYESQIEDLIKELEENTTAEIAVVTIDSLEGKTIEEYTFELFNTWGIGKADKNNGILFLVSLNDRSFRIEVGLGLRDIITSDIAKKILDETVLPNFKEKKYGKGSFECIKEISNYIVSPK